MTFSIRDNLFLVAAVALPLVVAIFFLLASLIPRWTVPDPAYDLVFRAARYDGAPGRVAVEFRIREGELEAVATGIDADRWTERWVLFLFAHGSMRVQQIPVELPAALPPGDTSVIRVGALSGRRLTADATAPDGYALATGTSGGGGIVGGLFGMRRYRQRLSLSRNGRVIALELPPPFDRQYGAPVQPVGWVVDGHR